MTLGNHFFRVSRPSALLVTTALVLIIALLDWRIAQNFSLGFLYVLPIFVGATAFNRWEIVALAIVCAVLRETFSPWGWEQDSLTREFVVLFTFSSAGLFVNELFRNRQRAIAHGLELEEQVHKREDAEEQLRVLVESHPAAILTTDTEGKILLANEAAHRLLVPDGSPLRGNPIERFLPDLANVLHSERSIPHFRTMMETTGHRASGGLFSAEVWFSTYETRAGRRLAAIILDSSEQLRERKGQDLDSLMTTSRVLVAAMLHEVRNLCAAAAVVHANLGRMPVLADNDDYRALGSLVKGLAGMASSELQLASSRRLASADLRSVLNELRIILEPNVAEAGVDLKWELPDRIPAARGDHHSLLQVFLNLAQNALNSMEETPQKQMTIAVAAEKGSVGVRFRDTGHGVEFPERLFQAFQPDSSGTGLGLYVSRALVRSFSGDLFFEPQPVGSCFVVRLSIAEGEV
jgi:two-component system sensor kinase FixL